MTRFRAQDVHEVEDNKWNVKKVPLSERQEQALIIKWAKLKGIELVHNCNEGRRTPVEGARLRHLGLAVGYPDLTLNVARGGYFGLYIEMKQNRVYTPSEMRRPSFVAQLRWLNKLNSENYLALMCFGAEKAQLVLEQYLSFPKTVTLMYSKIYPDQLGKKPHVDEKGIPIFPVE